MTYVEDCECEQCANERAYVPNIYNKLINLLATIHRDGGHYTQAHGLEKSYADAVVVAAAAVQHRCPAGPGGTGVTGGPP